MLLSSLWDATRLDDFEVPARPKVEATHLGEHKNGNDGTISWMYRLSLIQKSAQATATATVADQPKTTVPEWRKPLAPLQQNNSSSSSSRCSLRCTQCASRSVVQLEIFGCVQRLNHREITRWKQIAHVDLRKSKKNGKERRSSILNLHDGTIKSSVNIAGFSSGYRYQIVVRGVDAHGKRSLFSEPVVITPPK